MDTLLRVFAWLSLLVTLPRAFDLDGCGSSKGCWAVPPGCRVGSGEANATRSRQCACAVAWRVGPTGEVALQLHALLDDIKRSPWTGRYVAVAYSNDDKMGDDFVVDCVAKPDGSVSAHLSFNDLTSNQRLFEASKILISNVSGSIVDNQLYCSISLSNVQTKFHQIAEKDRFKIFDIHHNSYYLQIAKGATKPNFGFDLGIHGTQDGSLFPWISTELVAMKESKTVRSMKQTDVPRYLQYLFVKVHGISMLFGWWVFGTVAMLSARFCKFVSPNYKLLGTAPWFQIHRALMIVSIVLQLVAFALIFIQAGTLKTCSHTCDYKDYALKMHTILGISCTAAAFVQPFMAWARPSPTGRNRSFFNWLHWFVGTGSWIIACVTIFLAPNLGKAGLRKRYRYLSDNIMAAYVGSFVIATLLLEILSRRRTGHNTSSQLFIFNGPKSTEVEENTTTKPNSFLVSLAMFLFTIIAIGFCVWLSILIAS